MSQMQSALENFIKEELIVGEHKPIGPEDDLFTSGILDSLGVLRLVMFIEEQFSVAVPDEDVVFENFNTLSAIETYLNEKKGQSAMDGETQ